MNFPRKTGFLLILCAALASYGHYRGWEIPTLRWFYSFAAPPGSFEPESWRAHQATVVGIAFSALLALVGGVFLWKSRGFHWNPLTLRKMERFRSIGRGYGSYILLLLLVLVAMADQALVGRRALAVKYEGSWYFPAFVSKPYDATTFGQEGRGEANYRELKKQSEGTATQVWMPPVPWDPTFDSDEWMERSLEVRNGQLYEEGESQPYNGFAYAYHPDQGEHLLRSARIRQGRPEGPAEVYGPDGAPVGREVWQNGAMVNSSVPARVDAPSGGKWVRRIYMPLPPSLERGHLLGTDSKGWDILAQLFGGMQVVFKASVFYLLLTYVIGTVLGSMMGYFGGFFDLFMQRIIEILSNVPFLLVVLIITAQIGRDNISLATIIVVLGIFSWISVAIYLRTSTFKEKARDYVSAARVLGAGTSRVIFRHILPNTISTIVTLVPFSVSSVVASLTALDFLGFGVPDSYPSWGRVLNDGVENLGAPWIVSSVFVIMVLLLLLITFVGEAIREAFDPKKFTTYQ
ncbi:microcin C transport system permease protein [Haloferula luteola]|uniref:Microcin C transport system permease protein n=1 Tax=Haloferula luteola TaxID=595692 RepID=A0A840UZE2_9BACT|nr:ABC transporter permease [Haloferula luteola]MBB5350196.1 microcin C transport system permease protein [Haloferula luteola]